MPGPRTPQLRVYTFYNGVPHTVGFFDPEEAAAICLNPAKHGYPARNYYMGAVVERHQALGYVEQTPTSTKG